MILLVDVKFVLGVLGVYDDLLCSWLILLGDFVGDKFSGVFD